MCTVSVVAHRRGIRLMCNRDERRTRAAALPPLERRLGGQVALFPVDPEGGGTWVGVNHRGVILALLNRSVDLAGRPPGRLTSRGRIVPRLLRASSIDEAIREAGALPAAQFAPFRLVIVQGAVYATVTGGGARAAITALGVVSRPRMFSSSLGDAVVEHARRRVFDNLVAANPDRPLVAQRVFHRHQWADRRDISVSMARPDSRTVSRTCVDVDYVDGRVSMSYQPIDDDSASWDVAC